MSVIPNSQEFGVASPVNVGPRPPRSFRIEETYWGYIIRGTERAPAWLVVTQLASWVTGVIFLIFAMGLIGIPGNGNLSEMLWFRIGASVPLAIVSGLLFWYASRGTMIELEIDTSRGEVREVLRNRTGRSTLLGLYGFDSIGGVFLDRHRADGSRRSGLATLVLRYRNTSQVLRVARGSELALEALRDRLGRDLMVRKRKVDRMIENAMTNAA